MVAKQKRKPSSKEMEPRQTAELIVSVKEASKKLKKLTEAARLLRKGNKSH